jgi:hypothetical protein
MNIRQAKARFTTLTGLSAKKKSVYVAIRQRKGYYDWFISFGSGYNPGCDNWRDTRTTAFWTTLVSFLETLQEVV